jgi:hypothetical protein
MKEVSTFRLYLLRATYLLMAVGLGLTIWPVIVQHPLDVPLMKSVVRALLGTVGLLALIGLRYPLQMLPLLLFELAWKVIWLLAFALPLWNAGRMDPVTMETVKECLLGIVIFPVVIPWGYVFAHYARKSGDRWR